MSRSIRISIEGATKTSCAGQTGCACLHLEGGPMAAVCCRVFNKAILRHQRLPQCRAAETKLAKKLKKAYERGYDDNSPRCHLDL